jgi:hypothetical protein
MEVSKFLKKRKSGKQGYRAVLIRKNEHLQHDVMFAELQRRTPWLTSMTVDHSPFKRPNSRLGHGGGMHGREIEKRSNRSQISPDKKGFTASGK